MNKWPSLKQLHYLITLHETRHFHEAANRCFVSQSTLSKGIQNLEQVIGCPLYEKKENKSPLVFTPVGEKVVKQGRDLLAKSQDLLDLGSVCGELMQGEIRLGCIPTIAPFLLGHLVQAVNVKYPKLNLLLKEDTTVNLLQSLQHGELDVLILAMPVEIHGMACQIVGQDPFKMIMSQEQAKVIPFPIHYQDLPDASLFLLENDHCLTEHAVSACQLTQKEKVNPFSATSLHTLVQMVANGLGATFIPQMAIDHGLANHPNILITDPPGEKAYREIGVIWRPSSNRSDVFERLANLVQAILAQSKT